MSLFQVLRPKLINLGVPKSAKQFSNFALFKTSKFINLGVFKNTQFFKFFKISNFRITIFTVKIMTVPGHRKIRKVKNLKFVNYNFHPQNHDRSRTPKIIKVE